jgi:hypothetical protein
VNNRPSGTTSGNSPTQSCPTGATGLTGSNGQTTTFFDTVEGREETCVIRSEGAN